MQHTNTIRFLPGAAALIAATIIQVASAAPAANDGSVFKVQIVDDAMCCKGCAQKIAAQLYAAPGVTGVEVDLPNRTVVVTAKPSPKLTLELLWRAVEKGQGKPSRLATATAIYTLTRPEKLMPEERPTDGKYLLVVREMNSEAATQKIADQLYAVRGVKSIGVDMAQRMLVIEPSNPEPLSPWALASAVEKAGDAPLAVSGPHGVFRIEWSASAAPRAAVRPSVYQPQGGVR